MENEDFKIVCIVNVPEGLVNVFNDSTLDNMPFVQDFLYPNQLGCNNNNYLLITKDVTELKENVCSNNNWEILLIYDGVNNLFNNEYIFTEKTLVMYHHIPDKSEESLSNLNIKKYKCGVHEPNNGGYSLLLGLIKAWKNKSSNFDKNIYISTKKKIIKWFGVNDKLNAALEFLHKCLLKETPPDDLSILSEKGFTDVDLGKESDDGSSICNLFENMKCLKDDAYIKKLEALRDAVLLKVGVA